jgi:hypothetical protein
VSWQPSSNRRGRSESASESFVGGWAWGAKTSSTEFVVELVSGEPPLARAGGVFVFWPVTTALFALRARAAALSVSRAARSSGNGCR